MEIMNITETKAHLSQMIEHVIKGEEIIIGKAGKPVAKLIKYSNSDIKRTPGALKNKISIADDFDEMPEDIAAAFGSIEAKE